MKKFNSEKIYLGKIYHTLYDNMGYPCQEIDTNDAIAFKIISKKTDTSLSLFANQNKVELAYDVLTHKIYPFGNTKSYYSSLLIKPYCEMDYVIKPYTSLACVLPVCSSKKVAAEEIEKIVNSQRLEFQQNMTPQSLDLNNIKSFKMLVGEVFKIIVDSNLPKESKKSLLDLLVIMNNNYEEALLTNIKYASFFSPPNVEMEYIQIIKEYEQKILDIIALKRVRTK